MKEFKKNNNRIKNLKSRSNNYRNKTPLLLNKHKKPRNIMKSSWMNKGEHHILKEMVINRTMTIPNNILNVLAQQI